MNYRVILQNAVEKLLAHEDSQATSLFKRAIELGAPSCLVHLKAMTINYMILPMSNNTYQYYSMGIEDYFKELINLRNLAETYPDLQNDYIEALGSFLNIKELFLRVSGIDYSTEILKSTLGFYVEEVFNLFDVIHVNFNDFTARDFFNIRRYYPNTDLKEFALDLLEVKSFCLNLLLSYTTTEHTSFHSNGYTATTVINEPFAETTIRENTSMSTSATICPRLHLLRGKQAMYPEYKMLFERDVQEINKFRKFDCSKILREEIRKKVEHKATDKTGKDYFKFVKKYEKEAKRFDYLSSWFFIHYKIQGEVLNKILSINPICSFELDQVFTRKKFAGVCNMIANGKHWDISVIRIFFITFSFIFGLGIAAYALLALAMRFEKYPCVFVDKHC